MLFPHGVMIDSSFSLFCIDEVRPDRSQCVATRAVVRVNLEGVVPDFACMGTFWQTGGARPSADQERLKAAIAPRNTVRPIHCAVKGPVRGSVEAPGQFEDFLSRSDNTMPESVTPPAVTVAEKSPMSATLAFK